MRVQLAPAFGKTMQRQEVFHQVFAEPGETIAVAGNKLDKAGLAQLGQPGLQDGRRGVIAGGAQRARGQGAVVAQLPDDAQAPAPAAAFPTPSP